MDDQSDPRRDPQFSIRLSDGRQFGPASMAVLAGWAQEGRIPAEALLVPTDGGPVRAVMNEPALARLVQAPPIRSAGPVRPPESSAGIAALIPYKNAPALAGYYVGVFSLVPVIAILLGPIAIVLGCLGLSTARKNPQAKGKVHAIVAITLGSLTTLANVAVIALIVAMAIADAKAHSQRLTRPPPAPVRAPTVSPSR